MTEQPYVLRVPLAHSVRYVARDLPDVPNQYGPGTLRPSEITLTYRSAPDSQLGRVHAYVAGRIWVDGTELPVLPTGLYGQHYDEGLDGWPDWLIEEARLHDPETVRPRRGDQFAQWLKAQRAAADYPEAYQAVDGLLDLYRLHADADTPLDKHVCEGKVAGDCECFEAQQDGVQS